MNLVLDFNHGNAVAIDHHDVKFALSGFCGWHHIRRHPVKLDNTHLRVGAQAVGEELLGSRTLVAGYAAV